MNESQYECPHCGSDKDAFFSRIEPMGFYCSNCGEDVDACPECLEQARLLGMSAEREADLRGELERAKRELKQTREQYRLSSVCRGMQAQIDRLQKIVTVYELEKEK